MRTEHETDRAIGKYADMIKRICFLHLKNPDDTEDVFQNIFLKYILYSGTFENEEHEKAWFIRVTLNTCKDFMKSLMRHPTVPLDSVTKDIFLPEEHKEVITAVLSLPDKYKNIIYLFYYEGYTAIEIAGMLNKNENTIYSQLSRARKILKQKLGGEEFD